MGTGHKIQKQNKKLYQCDPELSKQGTTIPENCKNQRSHSEQVLYGRQMDFVQERAIAWVPVQVP